MSDFNLQVKVRNARLLRAMRAKGLASGADLAREAGISVSSACQMIALKRAPINRITGDYRPDAIAVCEALNVMPDDIWPHQIRDYIAPPKPSELEVSAEDLPALLGSVDGPEDGMIRKDLVRRLTAHLSPRQAEVIERRFGLNGPAELLEDVAQDFDVSRERIRQIEWKAIRVMSRQAKIMGIDA